MNILNQIFERSKNTKELLSIWEYKDDEKFWCGYIVDYNETLIKFQHFTKYGKKDGIIVARVGDIQSIDFNDDYAKAMQVVIDYSLELEKEDQIEIDINDDNWEYLMLKQLEGDFKKISSIEINSNYYTGFVLDVSETDFILQCIGKEGENEGTSLFKIEDVSGFRVNDIDNRRRAILYKWRQTKI